MWWLVISKEYTHGLDRDLKNKHVGVVIAQHAKAERYFDYDRSQSVAAAEGHHR